MKKRILTVFVILIVVYTGLISHPCIGDEECMGRFNGTIYLEGGGPFPGNMSVLCRNLGYEREYRYMSDTKEWDFIGEGSVWFERITTASPTYSAIMEFESFPEDPRPGESCFLREPGLYSETILFDQDDWDVLGNHTQTKNEACMENVVWYVRCDGDLDDNGIADDYEQELAERFCPVLFLHSGDRGVSPEPVEIMDATYSWRSNLYGEVTNYQVYVVGDWLTCKFYWCSNGEQIRCDHYWEIKGVEQYRGIDEGVTQSLPCNENHWIEWHFEWAGTDVNNPEGWYAEYEEIGDNYDDTVYTHLFKWGSQYVIQYWFFYPFNDFINDHEGDWEHINVILNVPNDDPLQAEIDEIVYYWHDSYKIVDTWFLVSGQTHPHVYVGGYGFFFHPTIGFADGYGSHGSYPFPTYWDEACGNIPYLETRADEFVDGQGRCILPEMFDVVVIKDRGEYNYLSEDAYYYSWLNANVRWGHVKSESPMGAANEAPRGPAWQGTWNTVYGGGGTEPYNSKFP